MIKKYLIIIFVVPLFLTFIYLFSFNYFESKGVSARQIPFEVLYTYQTQKAKISNAEIIFVGDSSLGNAINAEYFSALSEMKAANYALTGTFGFVGSLSMMKKAHNPNLKTVIIMHTPDTMTRDPAKDYAPTRWLQTNGFAGVDLSILNLITLRHFLKEMKNYLRGKNKAKKLIQNDYIKQEKRLALDTVFSSIEIKNIKDGKLKKLHDIRNFCEKQALRCIYVHGPLARPICEQSKAYLSHVKQMIREAEMRLASANPICIPLTEIGDSDDHIHPDFKDEYTRQYYEVLKSYLR